MTSTLITVGGDLRVGMEDTLTFSRGRPVTGNAELVRRAAQAARLAQRPLMAAEAREFLGIPARVAVPAVEPFRPVVRLLLQAMRVVLKAERGLAPRGLASHHG